MRDLKQRVQHTCQYHARVEVKNQKQKNSTITSPKKVLEAAQATQLLQQEKRKCVDSSNEDARVDGDLCDL
jgi:hypothetical protein